MSVWRKQKVIARAEKPTNPIRARELGYKAKKEFVIVRVRIKRGKRTRRKPDLGRKPGRNVKRVNPGRNLAFYAKQKAMKRFKNLLVVGSYLVGQDGVHKFFEIVMKDEHKSVPKKLVKLKAEEEKAELKVEAKKVVKAVGEKAVEASNAAKKVAGAKPDLKAKEK